MIACSCNRRSSASSVTPSSPVAASSTRRSKERPMTAAACATRLASPTRSRRAVMTSESVVGIASALTASPSASPRASSSRKRGTPSARCTSASRTSAAEPGRTGQLLEHRAGFLAAQPVELELGLRLQVRVVDDLWPGAQHHEHRLRPPCDHVHRFQGAGVGPMRVLHDEKEWCVTRLNIDPRGRLLRGRRGVTHDLTKRLEWTERSAPAAHQRHDRMATRLDLGAELEQQSAIFRSLAPPRRRRVDLTRSRGGPTARAASPMPRPGR